jgi:hypothetical protein
MSRRKLISSIAVCIILVSLYILVINPAKANSPSSSIKEPSADWSIECVDCPKSFIYTSDRTLKIDAQGHTHVAYGGDHLYYAWNDGSQWHYETVDPARGTGDHASLGLDSNGYPHISYYDSVNTALKYAYQDDGGWHIETIDSDGDVGGRSSLALDTFNMPHISYSDDTNIALKYASFDGISWNVETVDIAGATGLGFNISIAIDHNNLPHISYYDAAQDKPKYAYWNGSAWEIQTIDLAYAGQYTSIALDSGNLPHISISLKFYSIYNLMYAHWDGSTWDIQQVDGSNYAGVFNAIDLDTNGSPIIAYSTYDGKLMYAAWNGATWDLQTVAGSNDEYGAVALSLDLSGYPHISYQVERWNIDPIHTINQAAWDGSQWDFETIDSASEAGGPTSLALDENGKPRVAYRTGVLVNGAPANLSYASWDGNVWQSEVVVSDRNVAWDLSMAIDKNGDPHIAYIDYSNNAVKYAHWTGSTWDLQTLGTGSSVSLILDEADNPHLAFGQYHVYWDGNAWIYEVVDNMSGQEVSLALDSAGFAHISYYQNSQIKYVWWDGSQWTTQTVDTITPFSPQLSLALDHNDRPHISYAFGDTYENPKDVLKYATNNSGIWEINTVDSGGDVGEFNSIAMDNLDHPHISYLDVTNNVLKYAYWDGFNWILQTVVDIGFSYGSQGPSLKLDANNNPYISYYDWTTRDVMLATLIQPPVAPEEIQLSGPVEGEVQSSLAFTVTTNPISTTLPIRYIWEATDQVPITITNGLISSVNYSWDTPGTKTITVTASNSYGTLSTTHEITLSDVPISGISAVNNSPKFPGETVVFTATVSSGTNVSYTWDFGDGSVGSGASVTHVYTQAGSFTADVTASNSANSQSFSSPVTILSIGPSNRMFLPVVTK